MYIEDDHDDSESGEEGLAPDTKEEKSRLTSAAKAKSVPVLKPKPKSKKQKAAEQRRRLREMEAIADEIAEKVKLEEERAEKRKLRS
jgi:hypothetical protein